MRSGSFSWPCTAMLVVTSGSPASSIERDVPRQGGQQ